MRSPAVVILLGALVSPCLASADGNPGTALSVLPWNGAFLKVAQSEKRAALEFGSSLGALQYHLSLSAPLDDDSRRAAFTSDAGLVSGVQGSFSLTYSSVLAGLEAEANSDSVFKHQLCEEFYTENPPAPGALATACTGAAYQAWLTSRADAIRHSLGRRPIPERMKSRFFYEIGGEVTGSYDTLSIYSGDLASAPNDFRKSDVRVTALARAYFAPWFALTVKPGIEWNKGVSASTVNRCNTITSSSADVTGQSCNDSALFLLANPPSSTTFYFQWALTAILPTEISKATPGAEVGMRWDNLSGVSRRYVTVTSFLAPTTEPVVTKFGLGVEMTEALDDDPGGAFKAGRKWWTPFLIVGASM